MSDPARFEPGRFELRRVAPGELRRALRPPVDAETLAAAARIVDDVRERGLPALRAHAERLGDLAPGAPLLLGREELERALEALPRDQRALLERTAARIRAFAEAQRATLLPLELALPGGRAGHSIAPVERAGGYAPGGRYPLPSTALMTAIPARVAGVDEVWLASPRPAPITLAAAALAGADGLLAAGGAHAIAALAFGVEGLPAVDLIVGPGNRWVTAAKQLVAGRVGIDMLAGPSELVVLADETADPVTVVADLLAQAEHDDDALAVLVTTHAPLVGAVERELARQLEALGSATAARAMRNGFAVLAADLDEAARVCDELAPEHLELAVAEPRALARQLRHYGALFVGPLAAEVLGDYGAGPNHVLPTGRTARFTGGLSVHTFLRVRTFLELEDPAAAAELARDAAALARLEGLEGHARSAERRVCTETGEIPPVQAARPPEPVESLRSRYSPAMTRPRRASPSILDHIGGTPLVELARVGAGLPVPVLAKCEHMNPGGSIKDRIALAIVEEAERSGRLRPGDTLVEATAGNTGLGLALVAAVRGYRLVCVLAEKMSADKRVALAQVGAQVLVTKNAPPGDPDNFQQVAARLAAERGWFLTDQFKNAANVAVHERTTGPELLEQSGGAIGAFVAGVGTGGTITGVGRFLKARLADVQVVLADPVGSRLAGLIREGELGPDGAYAVEGIGSSEVPALFDPRLVDAVEEVSDEESFAMARRLVREEGLFVGGSAGTAVVAALRTAARAPAGPVVVVLPDAWDRYRSKPWMQAWGAS